MVVDDAEDAARLERREHARVERLAIDFHPVEVVAEADEQHDVDRGGDGDLLRGRLELLDVPEFRSCQPFVPEPSREAIEHERAVVTGHPALGAHESREDLRGVAGTGHRVEHPHSRFDTAEPQHLGRTTRGGDGLRET